MTADRSAAADDTLRAELANSLRRAMYDLPMDELGVDEQRAIFDLADALLPDWRRYADALVAAERKARWRDLVGIRVNRGSEAKPDWVTYHPNDVQLVYPSEQP